MTPRRIIAAVASVSLAVSSCTSAVAGTDATTNAPTSTGDVTAEPTSSATDGVGVFDATVVHDIAVEFDQADYDAMIETFQDTGDKEWIGATVTIDGQTFERVGLRLKGNSSLAGLSGRGPGDGEASVDAPQDLPWLIRFDELVDGQTYQGYEDLVVRSNNTETALNEAVSLALLDEAGLASQQAVATRFSVNGSDDVLRLVVEHPDDDAWEESWFDGEGALYKAESTGDWTYRGDDPASYEEVFDQEGGSDVADLAPLIEFLEFVNDSDDATFAAELTERLDVDAFATYLAMMDLIGNTDDIDGPGNNAYLWWDADTEQFTVVPWDMNLSLGTGMGGAGDFSDGGRAGGTMPEGFEPPGGTLPEGFEPPGGTLPEGFEPPQGGLRGGGPGGRSNPLVERFLANDEFNALYERRLTELEAELIDSGATESILAAWSDVLITHADDVVSADVVDSEASAIRDFLTG